MFQPHHTFTSQPQLSPPRTAMVPLPLPTHPTTIMTTGPSGEQKPRKLRASCDACSRAKVKCDKVRPTCHRCGNMGICCNYSPSMRLGKPRKHRNPDGTIMRDVSPANSCGALPTRADLIPRTTSHTAESSPEPSDPFFFGPATPEYHFQDAYMPATVPFDGSQSPYSDAGSFSSTGGGSGWSGDDHMLYHSPAEVFAPVPSFPPTQSAYTTHNRSTSVQSQPEMFAPMEGLHSPPMTSPPFYGGMEQQQSLPIFSPDKLNLSPTPMMAAPLPTPPASATVANHDCTQFAFQTLNSLYTPPSHTSRTDLVASVAGGPPTLDSVMATNKAAVDKLMVLLACNCSANIHFSTTIAFTVVKILSWYQAISGSSPSEADALVGSQTETFTPAPSSPNFKCEGEEERGHRTQLVLGELRKVEKLIDKFSERYCKSSVAADLGVEGGVCGALESLLRTRVRDTFKLTMRGAPEEVRRQVASRTQNRIRTHTM